MRIREEVSNGMRVMKIDNFDEVDNFVDSVPAPDRCHFCDKKDGLKKGLYSPAGSAGFIIIAICEDHLKDMNCK